MVEKLNIVQSATEPDKRNIWLKDNELKKFGAKGWGTIGGKGGGISLDGPQVSEPSGSELVPINDNGENKVITINNLLNKGKGVCNIIIDKESKSIVNNSEVLDAIKGGNKYFVIREEIGVNTSSYSVNEYPILSIEYTHMPVREVKLKVLQNNVMVTLTFILVDGHIKSEELSGVVPQQITEGISLLDTGATLEDVIKAYNNLLFSLAKSGLILG